MIVIESPSTREEILQALVRLHRESTDYWNLFSTDEFFCPLGLAWSPSDNVRHLTKSIRTVALTLKLPRVMLRLAFGQAAHPSCSFEEIRRKYQAVLAAGGQAGRFAPAPKTESDLANWRKRIMATREAAASALISAGGRWSEATLDRYQLPHPLLGKLTVREMLFFTLYHNLHHVQVVERRRKEQGQGEAVSGHVDILSTRTFGLT